MTKQNDNTKSVNVFITTSTFPRWKNDSVPGFVKDFAVLLKREGNAVYVLAPHFKGAKRNDNDFDGLKVHRYRYFWPSSAEDIVYEGHSPNKVSLSPVYLTKLLFFTVSQYLNLMLGGKTDIINAHWLIPQGFIAVTASILKRSKVVITIHGSDVFALNSKPLLILKRFALKRADAVVVNSERTKKAALQIYARREYHVIPPGVDTELFHIKKFNELKTDNLKILFVGRLSKEKGIDSIIKCLNYLPKSDLEKVTISIIGEGMQKMKLKALAEKFSKTEKIDFKGWMNHSSLAEEMRNHDVLIAPTRAEGSGVREAFGLVIAEAMSCGLAVITTGDKNESILIKDGENGYLVDIDSPEQIAERVIYLNNNKEEISAIGKRGSRFIADNFSWDRIIQQYNEVFRDVTKS